MRSSSEKVILSIATQSEIALGTANRQTHDIKSRLLALRTTSPPINGGSPELKVISFSNERSKLINEI
jgi:hypothetical protein